MERDTLEEILAIEKQIREDLDRETARARHWLEGVRHDVERAKLEEVARLEESGRQRRAAAEATARQKADAVVREAESRAARIDSISVEDLAELVRRHIACIAPGVRT